jgi:hypothetical protein
MMRLLRTIGLLVGLALCSWSTSQQAKADELCSSYSCLISCPGSSSYFAQFWTMSECCSYTDSSGCYSAGSFQCGGHGYIYQCPLL